MSTDPRSLKSANRASGPLKLLLATALFIAALATTSANASAAAFYVDPAGNDSSNGLSMATPFRSMAKLNSVALHAGDTVNLKAGSTWRETLNIDEDGTVFQKIVVKPYGQGAAPQLTGISTCINVTGDWVGVSGIAAVSCGKGIALYGNDNAVKDARVSDSSTGIHVGSGAQRAVLQNNVLSGNNRMAVLTADAPDDDTGAFGILIRGDYADVYNNTITGSRAFSYDYGHDGAAVEIYEGRQNRIHGNTATDNDTFVELGGWTRKPIGNKIFSNTVSSSHARSFGLVTRGGGDVWGPVSGTSFNENYVRLTGANSFGFTCGGGCGSDIVSITKNTFDVNGVGGWVDAMPTITGNLFVSGQLQVG